MSPFAHYTIEDAIRVIGDANKQDTQHPTRETRCFSKRNQACFLEQFENSRFSRTSETQTDDKEAVVSRFFFSSLYYSIENGGNTKRSKNL